MLNRWILACVSALAAGVLATPAWAAPPTVPLPPCADTVTPDQLSVGQDAIGFTVSQGSTVDSFDVKILGVLHSGIAPGRDLIVVDTSGPAIDQGGGIWFGMSGSPIYTLDGQLIGAIAYGFSTTSSIAGVTPADPDMLGVLDEPGASVLRKAAGSPSSQDQVALSHRVRARIARRERVRTSAVGDDMGQLKVPLSVSGLSPPRRAMLRRGAIDHHLPFFIPNVAGSSAARAASFGTVAPGDSFAAVISYGDVSLAGIGTTTYVCDGKALAFGHPFFLTGRSVLGASAASALGIIDDPIFGPFKLAEVTDPLGVVDRDRLAGIRTELGRRPRTAVITQDTKSLDTGRSRIGGETDVVQGAKAGFEGSFPFLALIHSVSNIDSVFDQVSGGSARISWTISGIKKRSGKGWRLTRSNRWISHNDISLASTSELLSTLAALDDQSLARIEFKGVRIHVQVEQELESLTIRKVLWSTSHTGYRPAHRLRVDPGQRISARVRMRPTGGGNPRTATLKFRAPRHGGSVGLITIGGGSSGGARDPFCALEGGCGRSTRAKSFGSLLAKLRHQPRNDDLVGELEVRHHGQRVIRHQPEVVDGRSRLLLLIGGGNRDHRPHHGPPVVSVPID